MVAVFRWSAFFLLIASPVLACEPCSHILSLEETVAQADVIVIGQQGDAGAMALPATGGIDRPEFIKVKVDKVLKGDPGILIAIVRSWFGMCPYGIQMNDKEALLFLTRTNKRPEDSFDIKSSRYDAVNNGCAQKSLSYNDGTINVHGVPMTVDAFTKKYLTKP